MKRENLWNTRSYLFERRGYKLKDNKQGSSKHQRGWKPEWGVCALNMPTRKEGCPLKLGLRVVIEGNEKLLLVCWMFELWQMISCWRGLIAKHRQKRGVVVLADEVKELPRKGCWSILEMSFVKVKAQNVWLHFLWGKFKLSLFECYALR